MRVRSPNESAGRCDIKKRQGWITISHLGKIFLFRVLKITLAKRRNRNASYQSGNENYTAAGPAAEIICQNVGIETALCMLKSKFSSKTSPEKQLSGSAGFYAAPLPAGLLICSAERTLIAEKDQNKILICLENPIKIIHLQTSSLFACSLQSESALAWKA